MLQYRKFGVELAKSPPFSSREQARTVP